MYTIVVDMKPPLSFLLSKSLFFAETVRLDVSAEQPGCGGPEEGAIRRRSAIQNERGEQPTDSNNHEIFRFLSFHFLPRVFGGKVVEAGV